MKKILLSEHPRHAWPVEYVNVKNKTVLDLGCGFFGLTHSFKQGKMSWADIPLPDMISSSEHWLNLGAKKVVGIDTNESDLNCLKEELKEKNVLFYNLCINSPEQIKELIVEHGADVVKADIEGAECHLIQMKDEDFKLVQEYYIEAHTSELIDMTQDKLISCGYEIRDCIGHIGGLTVFFAYKK